MPSLRLTGCRPTPLAHYLKGLGILRVVHQQFDSSVQASWIDDEMYLHTSRTREDLEDFFLNNYQPTALVAPWNGGSGFSPKDNKSALEAIEGSPCTRFDNYRETIGAAKRVLAKLGIVDKVEADQKHTLLEACRGEFPDAALDWLDAAFVITGSGAKFPPLLGTGGNDGRLEFSNNYMQRVLSLFSEQDGTPTPNAKELLAASLFGTKSNHFSRKAAVGQFLPSNAGGANSTTGFDDDSLINSWDFILMLEGAMLFSASSAKRLETDTGGMMSSPFTVRQVGVGYASASSDEDTSARAEMWMPLWNQPASFLEIDTLFSEGRAQVGRRKARNGVDFARAVSTLGVSRGITEFHRYGFQVRNGLSYFATPLSRFRVDSAGSADLLERHDDWISRIRSSVLAKEAPASIRSAVRQLDESILSYCQHADPPRAFHLFLQLGQLQKALTASLKWTTGKYIPPIAPLDGPRWLGVLDKVEDPNLVYELELALALGSLTGVATHEYLSPIEKRGHYFQWSEALSSSRDVVWGNRGLTDNLCEIFFRRSLQATKAGIRHFPNSSHRKAPLRAINRFVSMETNDTRLSQLIWSCALLDGISPSRSTEQAESPNALYSITKLCLSGEVPANEASSPLAALGDVPLDPTIFNRLRAGDGLGATRAACQRLVGSNLPPAIAPFDCRGPQLKRVAASLIFPLARHSLGTLLRHVVRRNFDHI